MELAHSKLLYTCGGMGVGKGFVEVLIDPPVIFLLYNVD